MLGRAIFIAVSPHLPFLLLGGVGEGCRVRELPSMGQGRGRRRGSGSALSRCGDAPSAVPLAWCLCGTTNPENPNKTHCSLLPHQNTSKRGRQSGGKQCYFVLRLADKTKVLCWEVSLKTTWAIHTQYLSSCQSCRKSVPEMCKIFF